MPMNERSLTIEERDEVKYFVAEGLHILGFESNGSEPADIVRAIHEHIDQQRAMLPDLSVDDIVDDIAKTMLRMGCLWGQQVCRHYNWEWGCLTQVFDTQEEYAVVAPDRSFVIFPLALIKKLLDEPTRENTIITLFEALQQPQAVQSVPGMYSILS